MDGIGTYVEEVALQGGLTAGESKIEGHVNDRSAVTETLQGWSAPRKPPRFEVESVTGRRRTDAAEQVQRGADHRDFARAGGGSGDRRSMPAPRDFGGDLL